MKREFLWLWLTGIPGLGNRRIARLQKVFPDIEELYRLSDTKKEQTRMRLETALGPKEGGHAKKDVSGFIESLLDNAQKERAKRQYDKYRNDAVKITTIESEDYPVRLKDIFEAPYILYYKGKLPDDKKKTASVVGARTCSEYGRNMAKHIAAKLAEQGVQVVSGFARGIDTAAHCGCLAAGGKTFAVFGNGVNRCYPCENKFTYEEILACGGGFLSEYPPDTGPRPGFFPMRNRIISALADVVMVIEAGEKSGSLVTADHALEQGRTVMALPGRVTDRLSMGCNRLIRQGAAIISSMEDIWFELGVSAPAMKNKNEICEINLAKHEKMLYSQLDFNPQCVDELIKKSGLSPELVSRTLIQMELAGLVQEKGGCYIRGQ